MSVSKSWAYQSEFGSERITAWAISRERAKYDGKPLGLTYWSTHKPGRRKPVKHVQKGATAFFAYINPADAANGGDGESLSHQLLKEAIAQLSGTRLKLGHQGEHDITITHGETEKLIPTINGTYYADAYLRFTSVTGLGLRWSGELYIEVHYAHAVPVDKQKELERSRVPVVEVPLLKVFVYPHEDENTSDPREAAHVLRIRNMLEKGFLAGRVISDRRSVEFLEQEVSRLDGELREARDGWDVAARARTEALGRLTISSARVAELELAAVQSARKAKTSAEAIGTLRTEIEAKNNEVSALRDLTDAHANVKANAIVPAQRKKSRLYWSVGGTLVFLVCLGVFFGYQQLAPDEAPTTAQPAKVPVGVQSSAAHSTAAVGRHAPRTTSQRRHRAPVQAADKEETDPASQ